MLVRLHVKAIDENELKKIVNNFIQKFESIIKNVELLEMEPYWKIEEQFKVLYELTMKEEISESEFNKTLQSVSDFWLDIGEPENRMLLASRNSNECTFLLENIEMITLMNINNLN